MSLLTPNAEEVVRKRWLRRDPSGDPAETVEQMFWRVAATVSQADLDPGPIADRFYGMMTNLDFLPNSPTFTGAGIEGMGQLAACFVLPVEDSMESIFTTLRKAALIQKTGGGNGFSFSRLRHKGSLVQSSMGQASGPVSFMKVYDSAFGAIFQGGARRGANMGVLDVDHPDIREFINCKRVEGEVANFNISVAITDAFIRAYKEDQPFDLKFRSVPVESISARELFREIATLAHHNGEPGVLFLDRSEATNPCPHLYTYRATNPCGEAWLGDHENCCLGSVNLARHITSDGQVMWSKLAQTVQDAVHFLDNVVTVNRYVPEVPELRAAAHASRRIGLGIMGLADALILCGYSYASAAGRQFAQQIMAFIQYNAMLASVELARTRGPFPHIKGSIFDPDDFRWPIPTDTRGIDWEYLVRQIKTHGIRNCAVTTIAPTGTLSTVAGVEGYGCEPIFALAYARWLVEGAGRKRLDYVSPLFQQALASQGYTADNPKTERILAHAQDFGSIQNTDLPPVLRELFVTANDISMEDHILMQAALQPYVSNAISKTINAPAATTVEEVEKAYLMAWELGCKGLTIYRTGSREQVVLETKSTVAAKSAETCPSCGAATLRHTEGCTTCDSCGYGKCSV